MVGELVIKQLTKTFKVNQSEILSLEAIDLTIPSAEFVTIIGPSGCGKTTLLRCIAGFEQPSGGSISIAGEPVKQPGRDRMVVFQSFEQLFPWLTVLKNITYALRVTRTFTDSKTREDIARKYLNLVGLLGYEELYPHQLSGGMKQRVAIARALAVQPQILLMDEPFGSLDALNRNILQEELVRIWRETKVTILFVTHSIEEAIQLGNQIIVFETNPGRIKALIPNTLPRPRFPETPEFTELWRELNTLLGLERQALTQAQPRRRIIFEDNQVVQPV